MSSPLHHILGLDDFMKGGACSARRGDFLPKKAKPPGGKPDGFRPMYRASERAGAWPFMAILQPLFKPSPSEVRPYPGCESLRRLTPACRRKSAVPAPKGVASVVNEEVRRLKYGAPVRPAALRGAPGDSQESNRNARHSNGRQLTCPARNGVLRRAVFKNCISSPRVGSFEEN